MNYAITLLSEDEIEALEELKIYSPAIPRVGEKVNIQVDAKHYNLKVNDVIYDFDRVGPKPKFGDYGCIDICLYVEVINA